MTTRYHSGNDSLRIVKRLFPFDIIFGDDNKPTITSRQPAATSSSTLPAKTSAKPSGTTILPTPTTGGKPSEPTKSQPSGGLGSGRGKEKEDKGSKDAEEEDKEEEKESNDSDEDEDSGESDESDDGGDDSEGDENEGEEGEEDEEEDSIDDEDDDDSEEGDSEEENNEEESEEDEGNEEDKGDKKSEEANQGGDFEQEKNKENSGSLPTPIASSPSRSSSTSMYTSILTIPRSTSSSSSSPSPSSFSSSTQSSAPPTNTFAPLSCLPDKQNPGMKTCIADYLYCDEPTGRCLPKIALGSNCTIDTQCFSSTCMNRVCVDRSAAAKDLILKDESGTTIEAGKVSGIVIGAVMGVALFVFGVRRLRRREPSRSLTTSMVMGPKSSGGNGGAPMAFHSNNFGARSRGSGSTSSFSVHSVRRSSPLSTSQFTAADLQAENSRPANPPAAREPSRASTQVETVDYSNGSRSESPMSAASKRMSKYNFLSQALTQMRESVSSSESSGRERESFNDKSPSRAVKSTALTDSYITIEESPAEPLKPQASLPENKEYVVEMETGYAVTGNQYEEQQDADYYMQGYTDVTPEQEQYMHQQVGYAHPYSSDQEYFDYAQQQQSQQEYYDAIAQNQVYNMGDQSRNSQRYSVYRSASDGATKIPSRTSLRRSLSHPSDSSLYAPYFANYGQDPAVFQAGHQVPTRPPLQALPPTPGAQAVDADELPPPPNAYLQDRSDIAQLPRSSFGTSLANMVMEAQFNKRQTKYLGRGNGIPNDYNYI
ncbi:uncharacterized protein VTP21DRAFT_1174 [Calcarisporiella thermophila]|uniref:uncharacterized protein n=1 Tax=Calcarisporiella thermophila TaxID=911321 RepID=UPI0037436047